MNQPLSGWYQQGNVERYWDGAQWTDHTRPVRPPDTPVTLDDFRPRGTGGARLVGILFLLSALGGVAYLYFQNNDTTSGGVIEYATPRSEQTSDLASVEAEDPSVAEQVPPAGVRLSVGDTQMVGDGVQVAGVDLRNDGDAAIALPEAVLIVDAQGREFVGEISRGNVFVGDVLCVNSAQPGEIVNPGTQIGVCVAFQSAGVTISEIRFQGEGGDLVAKPISAGAASP